MTLMSAVFTLFFVMDPLGNVPMFIAVLDNVPEHRRMKVLWREILISLFILLSGLLFGNYVMQHLGIKQAALNITGGIILFIIALRMIFPIKDSSAFGETPDGEPFIVPLAVPFIVGPSSLSIVMLMAAKEPTRIPEWIAAIAIAWVLNSAILLASYPISHFLGQKVMIAITRLMGMLLTAIAVQMALSGIAQFMASK